MENFKLVKTQNKSVNRSIRLSEDIHSKLCIMSEATNISYNKIVAKCIEFALANLKK